MKKSLCLMLLLVFLVSLLYGCSGDNDVLFYYCNADYLNAKSGSVLASETRDVTGYRDDLQFLVSLYLAGPLEQDLKLPFPAGTKLQSLLVNDSQITIQLYELPRALSDSDFYLACACLTMTCLESTDAQSVTILCGNRVVTLDKSMITFADTPLTTNATDGGSA